MRWSVLVRFWLVLAMCPHLPLWAASVQLMGWHYDPKTQALEFALSGESIPQLNFYDSPPRLVIDLPGVQLARSFRTVVHDRQVRQVRAGQINSTMGRLVLELNQAPEMSRVNLTKMAGSRWRIQLATNPPVVPVASVPPAAPALQLASNSTSLPPLPPNTVKLENFVFTEEGFLIRTTGPTEAGVRRLDGPPRLVVDLVGTVLPTQFTRRVFTADRLGVQQVRIGQFQARPPVTRIVLDVGADTWDWEAAYDPKLKGVRLVPAGRLAIAPPTVGTSLLSAALVGDQLVFDADGPLSFQATWNHSSREYQVQFATANLSPQFQGPVLDVGSPLDRLRLFPSEGQTITAILKVPQGVIVAGAQRQRGNRQFAVRLAKLGGAPL
ncbi:AMIN domain-containing protein, partial [Candidatus Cyanaurora vandensis]